jgi:hypothetical protein
MIIYLLFNVLLLNYNRNKNDIKGQIKRPLVSNSINASIAATNVLIITTR